MKYKNKFGTVSILDEISYFNNKRLAVSMSGGADSTMLCYLIAHTISKKKLNITIQPYTGYDIWAPIDSIGVIKVIEYIRKQFPSVDIQWPIFTVFNTEGAKAPNDKKFYITPLIEKLLKYKVVDIAMNGISMGPPTEAQQLFLDWEHKADLRRLPGQNLWHEVECAIDRLAPFKYIDKRFIIQCYKDFKIEDFLEITNSCTKPQGNCTKCWWCQERAWALNEVNS